MSSVHFLSHRLVLTLTSLLLYHYRISVYPIGQNEGGGFAARNMASNREICKFSFLTSSGIYILTEILFQAGKTSPFITKFVRDVSLDAQNRGSIAIFENRDGWYPCHNSRIIPRFYGLAIPSMCQRVLHPTYAQRLEME